MPCDTIRRKEETVQERQERVKRGLAKLEERLRTGQVTVVVGAAGSVAFRGWQGADREDVTDLCAFRKLQASGSTVLRQALARAEALAGRQADKIAIGGGLHSHDGGKTWGRH